MNTTRPTEDTNNAAPVRHDDLVADIDGRVSSIDHQLAGVERLRQERDRLLRARRALVGDEGAGPGLRLSASAVLAVLAEHPGSTAGELASLLGYEDSAVRAHLHRARQGGRCVARDRRWYVAGPTFENGAALVADGLAHEDSVQ